MPDDLIKGGEEIGLNDGFKEFEEFEDDDFSEEIDNKEKVSDNKPEILPTEKIEKITKEEREAVLQEIENGGSAKATGGLVGTTNAQSQRQRQIKEIEKILEDDLEELYVHMPSDKQKEFKEEGEKTVRRIEKILESTRISIGKIISLIKKWLSIIPGVNKFFLEQESKIKADEIIKAKKDFDNY